MKRVGILGGTFDPVHNGHIAIAKAAYCQLALNEVWIMPTGNSPHKRRETVTRDDLRVQMIEAAIRDVPYMKCCSYEVDKEDICFTSETLMDLCALYPGYAFYYIVGSDSFCYMDQWHDPETIFDMAHIVVAYRPTESMTGLLSQAEYIRRTFDARITLVHNDALDISSTQIRTYCKEGKELTGLVSDEVAAIIKENHIYQ